MQQKSPGQISLQDMMRARETRATRQRAMLARHALPLLSFTLNIPGPVKNNPLIKEGFAHALALLDALFERYNIPVLERQITRAFTGDELLCALKACPLQLKSLLCGLEGADAFGRLMDLDVISPEGLRVSREAAGFPPRACLLCEHPAGLCAPSRAHPVEALFAESQKILTDALRPARARHIGRLAQRSLIWEALATPKPGLVDRNNSGAHQDMTLDTLLDSAAVLGDYFEQSAHCGLLLASSSPTSVMEALRPLGLEAEAAMNRATGGVNTHRGAIYALGILCAAAGRIRENQEPLNADTLFDTARGIAAREAERLPQLLAAGETSDGLRQYALIGAGGARGEAAAGFPAVHKIALPQLRRYLNEGHGMNDALAFTLIHLIPEVEDSNLLKRAGLRRHQALRRQIQALLSQGPLKLPALLALDRQFIAENLSPGGCADLLAAACFAHLLLDQPTQS